VLECGHIFDFAEECRHALLVTENCTNPSIIDGIDDGINSKGGIDSCDAHRLRVGAKRSNHPLRACILKNGQSTTGGELVKSGIFGRSYKARRAQGSTKLVRGVPDLVIGPETRLTELLHLGSVLTEVFTLGHGVTMSKCFVGIVGEFMERRHRIDGGIHHVVLVFRIHTMRFIVGDGHGTQRRGGQQFLDDTNPLESDECDEKVNGDQYDLEGKESETHDCLNNNAKQASVGGMGCGAFVQWSMM